MKDFSLSSNQYRYVLAVVQEQSFSAAAQKLYMTQPALSQAIIKLENQLNIKIFDRSTVPVSLTDEGEVFVEIAKEILECERTLEDRLSFMDKTISGRLT
ncbi:MAG: LysR family transcriptional regulator, partial [Oscillospiraceae bacterium]|nr:LysR family transcriptional regulator [Oscillospiraceae bacterium]